MRNLGISNFITFEYEGDKWMIKNASGDMFIIKNENVQILFKAKGRNGATYTDIVNVWDKVTDKIYSAKRYHYKYISLICEAGYILAKNDYLWDYEANEPLSVTREESLMHVQAF